MVKFVVLTTQRSGATFFIKCLDSYPQIACRHQTVFTQDSKFKFFSFDRPSSFYYQYRTSSLKRRLRHILQRKQLVYDCLNDYLHTLPSDSKVIGLKVSYNHIGKYPAIVAWIKEHNVRIIHLIRNNILKTIISLETAQKRRQFHSTQKVKPVQVCLRPGKLKRNLARRERLIKQYRAMFTDQPYLEVSYEAFVADRKAELQRVLQFFEVEVDRSVSLEADLVKLNPDSIEDIIENYEQIAQVLQGTSFEKYLTM